MCFLINGSWEGLGSLGYLSNGRLSSRSEDGGDVYETQSGEEEGCLACLQMYGQLLTSSMCWIDTSLPLCCQYKAKISHSVFSIHIWCEYWFTLVIISIYMYRGLDKEWWNWTLKTQTEQTIRVFQSTVHEPAVSAPPGVSYSARSQVQIS